MELLQVERTALYGCLVITAKVFEDDRGYFYETFNRKSFEDQLNLNVEFVQDNESLSTKGVLRGLHFQKGEHAQAKLVRVVHGSIVDAVVDCRTGSPTFGQHLTVELSSENKKQLFIPKGFAHGFYTLSESAIVNYKCDTYYNEHAEGGIRYDDPFLGIDWQLQGKPIISEKDAELPNFKKVFP